MKPTLEHRLLKNSSGDELTGGVISPTYCIRFDNVDLDWVMLEEEAIPGFADLCKQHGTSAVKPMLPENAFVGHIRAVHEDIYLADLGYPKRPWYVGYRVIEPIHDAEFFRQVTDPGPSIWQERAGSYNILFNGGSLDLGLSIPCIAKHLKVTSSSDGKRLYTWNDIWLKQGNMWNEELAYTIQGWEPITVSELDI